MSEKFQYKSRVNFYLQQNDKKILLDEKKNAGTPEFFKFLCDCIVGNYNESNRPYYLDLIDSGGSSYLLSPIQMTAWTSESTESTPVARGTGLILGVSMKPNSHISEDDFICLKSLNKEVLCELTLSEDIATAINDLDSGMNLIVEWTLYFENPSA